MTTSLPVMGAVQLPLGILGTVERSWGSAYPPRPPESLAQERLIARGGGVPRPGSPGKARSRP
jgi:hypothetical protein